MVNHAPQPQLAVGESGDGLPLKEIVAGSAELAGMVVGTRIAG